MPGGGFQGRQEEAGEGRPTGRTPTGTRVRDRFTDRISPCDVTRVSRWMLAPPPRR